jgi:FkbM family methyltransferase
MDGLCRTSLFAYQRKESSSHHFMNSFIRRFTEKVLRNRTFKRFLEVAGTRCPIYVSPDAQLKYLKRGRRAFDADLLALAEKFVGPSSVVWDVGGNVGVFGFASASIAKQGTVVIFEPDIWLAGVLRKTVALDFYQDRDIRIVPCAASLGAGLARFMISGRGRASNALEAAGGRSQMGGVRQYDWVPTLSLDLAKIDLPVPHFIKIDVEGAELMVIQGAAELIKVNRPLFYIEIGSDVWDQVTAIFKEPDYIAFDYTGTGMVLSPEMNVLFIPREKLEP